MTFAKLNVGGIRGTYATPPAGLTSAPRPWAMASAMRRRATPGTQEATAPLLR